MLTEEQAQRIAAHPLSVVVCIPTLTGKLDTNMTMAWDETRRLLLVNDIPHIVTMIRGDAFIDKARNRAVTAFINDTTANNLFFLDDDVGWPPEKFVEFLTRPEDIVCAAYPKKTDDGKIYPFQFATPHGHIVEQKGLYLLNWGPTGFMRIKRRVLMEATARADVYPEQLDHFGGTQMMYSVFEAGSFPPANGTPTWTDPFGREHAARDWRGEDIYFCDKVRTEIGAEIWLDPNVEMTHRGLKVWSGTYAVDHAEQIAQHSPKQRTAIERVLGDLSEAAD